MRSPLLFKSGKNVKTPMLGQKQRSRGSEFVLIKTNELMGKNEPKLSRQTNMSRHTLSLNSVLLNPEGRDFYREA